MVSCSYCGRPSVHAKDLCGSCYARLLQNGSPERVKVRKIVKCASCGEEREHKAKGLCVNCYARLSKRGTTEYRQWDKDKPCTVCGTVPAVAKGLCRACYQRQWHRGTTDYAEKGKSSCLVEGCTGLVTSFGYCRKHWERIKSTGDPNKTKRPDKWGEYLSHPLYATWNSMRQRCMNKNSHQYKYYGARGVKVCNRWDDFWKFVEDMGPKPGPEYSIDRIDTHSDYSPGNCRWATAAEQAQNRRNNVLVKEQADSIRILYDNGKTYREIADALRIEYSTVRSVIAQNTWQ